MSSVGTLLHTFRDASGKITVTVFWSKGSPEQQIWLDQEVLVPDPDMVAIGGGGEATDGVENTMTPGTGAFLTASYPNGNLSGWVVGARDQEIPQAYSLLSYVIGMKVAGLSRQQLLGHIVRNVGESGAGNHPEAEVGIASDTFVLVGGGFRVEQGIANLGTASFPSSPFSWKARSQDHLVPSAASLQVFAIGIHKNLPGVGRVISNFMSSSSGQAGHPAAEVTLEEGFALTGGGAQVQEGVNGNLLWKLVPATELTPTYEVASADHQVPGPATITAYAVGLRIG